MEPQITTKAGFSRLLGVSKPRVSQYVAMGLPVRADGRLNLDEALRWVRENIVPPWPPARDEDIALSDGDLERILG